MTLVNYPQTLTEVFTSQIKPLLALAIVSLILAVSQRLFQFHWLKRFSPIDFFPVFAMVTIPILTLNQQGNTWLPLLICIWMGSGIMGVLYVIGTTGDFILKRFLFIFWRASDLYLLAMYVIILVWKICQVI